MDVARAGNGHRSEILKVRLPLRLEGRSTVLATLPLESKVFARSEAHQIGIGVLRLASLLYRQHRQLTPVEVVFDRALSDGVDVLNALVSTQCMRGFAARL